MDDDEADDAELEGLKEGYGAVFIDTLHFV